MKIVVDENIPQAREAFDSFGELIFSTGRKISKELLADIDVLLVRSITNVNEKLLTGTNVKFVATATAGTDHVDKEYLIRNKITFADAAGCNSFSVAEYLIAALSNIFSNNNFSFNGKSLGIVGIGNVGSKVASFAKALGFNVLQNDPPIERKSGVKDFVPLEDILQCDIISLHVPLTHSGIDKTYHLLNEKNLNQIKSGTILINTSRGEVVDNEALKKRLQNKNDLITVLDVWENEPNIDFELLKMVNLCSAHIAGYSLEGKVNGTEIIYNKLCDFLGITPNWEAKYPAISNSVITIDRRLSLEELLNDIINQIYTIEKDDKLLREGINLGMHQQAKHFDDLRKNYPVRREFNNYTIKLNFADPEIKKKLESLRFNVI
ncbi:MAG: 4-phosphoerythronate dehydrogenase [Ignavibacteriales bacterium]|nr:4-phosphoerythronate dehydrogenase [Ignavibacteriales bacterium]